MLAIVCPGQGSQTPGFLTPWLELDGMRDELTRLSEATGLDLVAHGTTSDAETIKDTAIAQPLIVGAGLIALPPLLGAAASTLDGVDLLAGHSVGEITATAAAGVLAADDAVVFVRERGRSMAAASAVTPTGMAAVLGGDPTDVLAVLERHGLTAANVNGAGQTVAAGTLEQLEALQADPPAKARVIPLQVAGAFHTHHMAPAVSTLGELAGTLPTQAPTVTLLSNADGRAVTDGREALDRLVRQVSNPVRWDLCMQTMQELGVTGIIELPPAGTLVGLAKRALKGVETLALKTPDDLEAAQRMISEHGGSPASPTSPTRVDE
ncbi:ACP S-malonyltransferase [Intrasporangium calvum]|uniref:[acyl-carrier-protein] S-malonyltransferase n=1 Tax=Intrasporangium calvum (strain ATCC 23552 / DSM 43043 / JCM 3097 / NBRC 12989 / NCIMB 10167 / NRRL B-3866 / 7 KIP) TaxID=710696 RepID=E6SCY5_INTC7|nr:ACP S-malonyltransferase [Intrasporangium calvum]ADU48573.1 (Acyl-carrier-protein) S-malonyltransferase [Intrasporangium calvum DSM 43043]AXG13584.1 ACP S-malonyltransferase [Intrasporangium calvum]